MKTVVPKQRFEVVVIVVVHIVEEVLRFEAPVQGLPRVVARDTELGGYALKKGDVMMLRYGAANRDERQFARELPRKAAFPPP